jgi:hypothetical protein
MANLAGGFALGTWARVSEHPFRHVTFGEDTVVPRAVADRLIEAFPGPDTLVGTRRSHGGDKTYAMNTVALHERGRWHVPPDRLAPCWQEFLVDLVESDYRYGMARLLDIPEAAIELEVRLTEYPRGGWLSRHTDRPDKLFSQNIYLCRGWRPEWGGGLALYADEHVADPAVVLVPGTGTSVAFARSDHSWHEVTPVSDLAGAPRRALLVHGYRLTR